MRNALLIAVRELTEHVRTKGFWVGLLALPITLLVLAQLPVLIEEKGLPTRYFVLIDASGQLEHAVTNAIERANEWGAPFRRMAAGTPATNRGPTTAKLRFRRVPLPADVPADGDLAAQAQALKPYLRGERRIMMNGGRERLFAAVLIPKDILSKPPAASAAPANNAFHGIQFWSENLADADLRDEIERAVNAEARRREYLARGVDQAAVRTIEGTRVPFASLSPRKAATEATVRRDDMIRQWAPSAFVYLLWLSLFAITWMLLANMIEEKANRIVEVLLSSATPMELMGGKLLGIAAVGLIMVGAWLGSGLAIVMWKAAGAGPADGAALAGLAGEVISVLRSSWLVPAFIVYFLLGYAFYAGLFLAIGSTCNTIKDAQGFMNVAVLVMMLPLGMMLFIPRDPHGPLAVVLSWIPLYTPFVMMNRISAGPAWWEVVGTTLLLALSAAGALWLSARIFRQGILRTGQPPRWRELWRWLRAGG